MIEDLMDRLVGYRKTFNNSIGENILINELLNVCVDFKRYIENRKIIDYKGIEKTISKLESRNNIVKSTINTLSSRIESMSANLNSLKEGNLKRIDQVSSLKAEDKVIPENVKSLSDNSGMNFDGINEILSLTRSTIDEDKSIITGKINKAMDEKRTLDVDKVSGIISIYAQSDIVIKETINEHLGVKLSELSRIMEKLNIESITKEMNGLTFKEDKYTDSTDAIKKLMAKNLNDLKNNNSKLIDRIKGMRLTADLYINDLERGSIEAEKDKLPIGSMGGKIDDTWIKQETSSI